MRTNRIIYFLIILVLCACTNKSKETGKGDWVLWIKGTLENQKNGGNKKQLCLFIADNMCSECIIKEYINIKSDSIIVTVIGLFEGKRNFRTSINQSFLKNSVFIDRAQVSGNDIPNNIPIHPVYFIYDKKEKTVSEVFYPLPCEEEKTRSYFKKIKTTYQVQTKIGD